jgi:hypothetical protein
MRQVKGAERKALDLHGGASRLPPSTSPFDFNIQMVALRAKRF